MFLPFIFEDNEKISRINVTKNKKKEEKEKDMIEHVRRGKKIRKLSVMQDV